MPVVVHVRVVDDFFVQFIDWVDVPVLCSDVFAVLDTVVDMPVVVQRLVLGVRQCRKLWNFRSCSAVMVVDVPVYAVHRRLWTSL